MGRANSLPESNRRPTSPFTAGSKFRRTVYDRDCILGAGCSAKRLVAR